MYRKLARTAFFGCLVGALGCGTAPVAPPTVTNDNRGEVSGDNDAGRPAIEDVAAISAGIYSGTTACSSVETRNGVRTGEAANSVAFSVVFGDSGVPLFAPNDEMSPGDVEVVSMGDAELSNFLTGVVPSTNGVVLAGQARLELDCGDSCVYAFDGICDEVQYCALGTDCFDCGPTVFTGPARATYQVINDRQIQRILTVALREEDAGLAELTLQCEGTLTR